jgi:uncharacterized 2Fe-2S/4Fe-4S cluster protein (DUF4445 family)
MREHSVTFLPQNKTVHVNAAASLLEAALKAHITINNLCGGDGICGRCKMIIVRGKVTGAVSAKLTREEILKGYVLACQTPVADDLAVEIPLETQAKEKAHAAEDAERFRDFVEEFQYESRLSPAPLVTKVHLEMEPPTLANNIADHQRLDEAIRKKLKYRSMQMGLKIIKNLPEVLRKADYDITATVGLRREIAEVMDIEPGDTSAQGYMAVVDMGTTTIVAHLVDALTMKTCNDFWSKTSTV